jgi:aspartate/methionine/tyrosine aminotransferase
MFASRTNWPLEPNRFATALEEHRRRGRPLFDLTNSNPTTCGICYPEGRLLAALSDRRALRYEPASKGLHEARAAIADYYRHRTGFFGAAVDIDPERIIITSGTSEAYSYVFRVLCEVGDEVLVPAPGYPLFDYLADLADIRTNSYPLLYDQGWQVDFAGLEAALSARSKAVMVVHPNNPTGSYIKSQEARQLAEICARREMAIIADEVFLDYADDSGPHPSFAFDGPALTFTLSGLSKISLLPQMKLAWIVVSGPEALAAAAVARLEVIGDSYLSPSTPGQIALPEMLAMHENLQAQMRQRLCANLAFLDEQLCDGGPVNRLEREGGWYAVLRVPATGADEDLAVALLERCDVLVHPGHFFDFPRDGFLVVSLIAPEADFQEGVRRLHRYFAGHHSFASGQNTP